MLSYLIPSPHTCIRAQMIILIAKNEKKMKKEERKKKEGRRIFTTEKKRRTRRKKTERAFFQTKAKTFESATKSDSHIQRGKR